MAYTENPMLFADGVDMILLAQDFLGYDNKAELEDTWIRLCELFSKNHIVADKELFTKFLNALLFHFSKNQDHILHRCQCVADVLDLFNIGFFSNLELYFLARKKVEKLIEKGRIGRTERMNTDIIHRFFLHEGIANEFLNQYVRINEGNSTDSESINIVNEALRIDKEISAIDYLLTSQYVNGYDNAQELIETWKTLCLLHYEGLKSSCTDYENLLISAIVNKLQRNWEIILRSCFSVADVFLLYESGYFRSIKSFNLAKQKVEKLIGVNLIGGNRIKKETAIRFFGSELGNVFITQYNIESSRNDPVIVTNMYGTGLNENDESKQKKPSENTADSSSSSSSSSSISSSSSSLDNMFSVVAKLFRKYPVFNLEGREIQVKIRKNMKIDNPIDFVSDFFKFALANLIDDVDESTYMGLTIESDQCMLGRPIYVPWGKKAFMNEERIIRAVEHVVQSNQNFFLTENIRIKVHLVDCKKGQGTNKRSAKDKFIALETFFNQDVFQIKDKIYCLPLAVVLGRSRADKKYAETRELKRCPNTWLNKAKILCVKAGVNINEQNGCTLQDVQKFQNYLGPSYQIIVYEKNAKNRECNIIFEAPLAEKKIFLYYYNNHYDYIPSITNFLKMKKYCPYCLVGYNNAVSHTCNFTCTYCARKHKPCVDTGKGIICDKCFRYFPDENCFLNHKKPLREGGKSLCEQFFICASCGVSVDLRKRKKKNSMHACGEHLCKSCFNYVESNHVCYVEKENLVPVKQYMYLIFDTESLLMEANSNGEREHVVNLVCCSSRCFHCKNYVDNAKCTICGIKCGKCVDSEKCTECGVRDIDFKNLEAFISYVLQPRKQFQKLIVLSHCGGKYDNVLAAKVIIEKQGICPTVIMQGQKILEMKIHNHIIFRDTYLYMQIKLADLPKTLGLSNSDNLKKGIFPYLINTSEMQGYDDVWPDLKYYDLDSRSEEEAEEIRVWHKKCVQKGLKFNLEKELLEYCMQDVRILTAAVIKFSDLIETKTGGIQCFIQSCTIASLAMKTFRSLYLESNSIPIIPPLGYAHESHQSIAALQWLRWVEYERKQPIRRSENGGELKIGIYKVDGCDIQNKLIWEYNGCRFHGHRDCYPYLRHEPVDGGESMEDRYQRTVAKEKYLNRLGYTVITMWECKWKKEIKENNEIKEFIKFQCQDIIHQLRPKDAFQGGRTEVFKSYYTCNENTQLLYNDVTSLYSFVMRDKYLPVGPPKIYKGTAVQGINVRNVHGLILCKILAPQKLHLPVIGYNTNNKLLFGLCRTCMDEQNQDDCRHTEQQRSWITTICSPELNKALDCGYEVKEVYEIWEFEMKKGLFKDYINSFLKMKQQASGYSDHCKTEKDKQAYIEEYEKTENIKLEYNEISKNPGLRYISKLFLNSLYGKWGQRCDLPHTKIVQDGKSFLDLVLAPKNEISTVVPIGEKALIVTYKDEENINKPSSFSNVVLASFITSWARLELYSLMAKVGYKRIMYVDTDSIVYISNRNEKPRLSLSSKLGGLTNEIPNGWEMCTFIAIGPKNYCFRIRNVSTHETKDIFKIRGIQLDKRNRQEINFEWFYNLIKNQTEQKVLFNPNNIARKPGFVIVSRSQVITHRMVTNKRIKLTKDSVEIDPRTVPYGFVQK